MPGDPASSTVGADGRPEQAGVCLGAPGPVCTASGELASSHGLHRTRNLPQGATRTRAASDVGITAQSGRRVSGLRREEVAMLAGVSVDYYTRLEQGRERNPSPAVLNALAGALALDTDLREHLFRLAGLAPTPPTPVRKTVDDSLRELLSSWSHTPALIIDRRLDVLAYNELAGALYSGFERIDNLVRMTFLDPSGAASSPIGSAPRRRASRISGSLWATPARSTTFVPRSRDARCERGVPRTVESARCAGQNTRGQGVPASCRRRSRPRIQRIRRSQRTWTSVDRVPGLCRLAQ